MINNDAMKRFSCLKAALAAAAAMMAASCQQDNLTPELSFDKTEFEVPATGGKVEVTYSISNPVSGAEWSYTCDSEWVEDCDFTTEGVIAVTVSPNYVEEERSAVVTFVYSALDKEFPVTLVQQPGSPLMPSVVFDPAVAEVAAEGGSVTVSYTVENPVAGESLSGTADAEWITDLDTSVDGKVSFNVSLSYVEEERTADIKFEYADMEFVLPVVQAVGNPDDAFDLSLPEITPITATIKVVPADSVMTYTVFATDKEYYYSITPEDFITQNLNAYAAIAGMAGLSFEDFMEQEVLASKTTFWFKDQLLPDTEYIFLVVGMLSSGTITTEFFVEEYTTESIEKVDISFTFDIVPDEVSATVTTTPSRNDVKYYSDVKLLSDMPAGENMTQEDMQNWVNMKIWQGSVMGLTPQQVVENIVAEGTQTKEYLNLESETDYVVFAAALDPDGIVISDCYANEFKTKAVSASQNTFDITIEPKVASFVLNIVPSIDTDKYTVAVVEPESAQGKTDEEYAAELAKTLHVMWNERTGPAEIEITQLNLIDKLTSGTEYKIMVFGVTDGIVTTSVSSFLEKTLEQESHTTFDADIAVGSLISTDGVYLNIEVNQQTTLYLAGVVPVDFTDEMTLKRIDLYANRLVENQMCGSYAKALGYLGYRGSRNDDTKFYPYNEQGRVDYLVAGTEYKPYIVAVDDKTGEYASVIYGDSFMVEASGTMQPIIEKFPYNANLKDIDSKTDKADKNVFSKESELSYRLGKMFPTRIK